MSEQGVALQSPFPGLRPFTAADVDVFFGRDREIEEILDRLTRSRFVAVVGVSGCGKSSLVRAGVVPVLESGLAPQLGERWLIGLLRPGGGPVGELRNELRRLFPGKVSSEWPETSFALRELLESALPAGTRFALIVDQFEEIFRYRRESLKRDGGNETELFVKLLLNVIEQGDCGGNVLLTMRSDYLGDCAQFLGLPEAISSSVYLTPRMRRNQRREAIERPVRAFGIEVTSRFVDAMLNASSEDPDDLPVMQHALRRAFEKWRRRDTAGVPLDVDDYVAAGGLEHAISDHADEVLDEVKEQLGEPGVTATRRMFQRLVDLDSSGRETRRPTVLRELAGVAGVDASAIVRLIERFREDGRNFLTPYGEELKEDTTIDVSHECLLRRWRILREQWIPEEQESRRNVERLAIRAEESAEKEIVDGTRLAIRQPYRFEELLSGTRLGEVLRWRERRKPSAAWAQRYYADFALVEAFIETSRQKNAQGVASAWDDEAEIERQLRRALETFDWKHAKELCDSLVKRVNVAVEPIPERLARKLLSMLRRSRQAALAEGLAEAIVRSGTRTPTLLRKWAQALVDQGKCDEGVRVARMVIDDELAPPAEADEARAVIGRVYKDQYLAAPEPRNEAAKEGLRKAIEEYFEIYQTGRANLFHATSLVALLGKAERDGITISPKFPDFRVLAASIEKLVEGRAELGPWDEVTAAEVALAMGAYDLAVARVERYLESPSAEAFDCEALLRQLTNMWGLTEAEEPGSRLLPMVRAKLLAIGGSAIKVSDSGVAGDAPLERAFGWDRFVTLRSYKVALQRSAGVARVQTNKGEAYGTGFLVRASDFFDDSPHRILLLTCSCLVAADGPDRYAGAMLPAVAQVVFSEAGKPYEVDEVIWSSPLEELDATFLSLKDVSGGSELEAAALPIAPQRMRMAEPPPRCYIIGYAGGRSECSISDGALLGLSERLLHYRTPTEPGSGGSPTFDANWNVVALHHRRNLRMPRLTGVGVYEAAEGVSIHEIKTATHGGLRPPAPGRRTQVYLSYTGVHKLSIPMLAEVLTKEYRWEFTNSWVPGYSSADEVAARVRDADVFVSLIDERSLRSSQLHAELQVAVDAKKRIVTVLLSDSVLANSLPIEMQGTACVRLPGGLDMPAEEAARRVGAMIRDATVQLE